MKLRTLCLTAFVVSTAALIAGCEKKDGADGAKDKVDKATTKTSEAADKAGEAAKKAIDDVSGD